MKDVQRTILLISLAIVARGQDSNRASSLSSNAIYLPLSRYALIQGEVIVLLSKAPDGRIEGLTTGHPLLIAGIKPDEVHWKEWAAIGIERVTYVFKMNPRRFVTTNVQVPRSRLVRLIPWVKKTRTEAHIEQQLLLPKDGIRDIETTGKILRVTITVDTVIPEVRSGGVA